MYLDTIEATEVSHTGLSFLKDMNYLSENVMIHQLPNRHISSMNALFPVLPDLAIPGDYHQREGLFDLDPQIKSKPDSILLITGIPINAPNLDIYKFKDAQYAQYLETEDNKGILFQVVPSNSRLIPISYGAH